MDGFDPNTILTTLAFFPFGFLLTTLASLFGIIQLFAETVLASL